MKATRVAEDELRFAKNRERERTFARSLGWLGCFKQVVPGGGGAMRRAGRAGLGQSVGSA